MKFKIPIKQIAVIPIIGLTFAPLAMADPAGKAVSYVDVEDIIFFPDNDNDGAPDPGVAVTTTQTDIPATSSSANKIGVPDSGSTILDPVSGRGPMNVDQACVARPPAGLPAAQDPPFAAPCPDNDTFVDVDSVPGFDPFPNNNVARADGKVFGQEGFIFPGNTCPDDGEGACGIVGNDFADVTSIAEVQANEIFEQLVSESDTVDTASFILDQDSAITVTFQLDWCRQAQLLNAFAPSIARAATNGNVEIRNQETGEVVFDANASGLFPAILDLNGNTEIIPLANMTTTGLLSEDVAGTAGNPPCFPRPINAAITVVINTNPDGLSAADCANEGTACFIAQADTEYTFNVDEGTDVDTLVAPPPPEINVFKWYFGKQNPPYGEDNMQLPFPFVAEDVMLNDQFGSVTHDVVRLIGLMNPAIKNGETDDAGDQHLSCYQLGIGSPFTPPPGAVPFETTNFGFDTARVGFPRELCVSAMKNDEGSTVGPAYKCYDASSPQTQPSVFLDDQFDDLDGDRTVRGLSRFCTPVGKNAPDPAPVEDPADPTTWAHLACYEIPYTRIFPFINVQLGDMIIEDALGIPGEKITFSAEFERRFCEPAIKLLDS